MPFLEEVLEALKEKYEKPTKSKKKQVSECKAEAEESEDPVMENQEEKEDSTENIKMEIEKLEEAHIAFSKKFGEEEEDSPNKEVLKEMEEIKEHLIDIKQELEGEKTSELPLWDKPNEEGNTPLHLSIMHKKPAATSLLLRYNADTIIQDSRGRTPLHLACHQQDIEQATKLVAHKAKMIPDNENNSPPIENLIYKNQDLAKVRSLMTEVYQSKEKVKIFKRLLEEKRALFIFLEQPEMLGAILERDEPDPDVEEFINIHDAEEKFKTVIHVTTDKRCYKSLSVLLKAGNYQLKLDGAGSLPNIESLFNLDDAAKITEIHVRGLLQKTRMKILKPEDCWKSLSQQKNYVRCTDVYQPSHMNLLSSLTMGLATWFEVVSLPSNGLKFSIINTEVPSALLSWYKAESTGKGADDEAADVRKLLEKKGVFVRESLEEIELMPAIRRWNEKNTHFCEYLCQTLARSIFQLSRQDLTNGRTKVFQEVLADLNKLQKLEDVLGRQMLTF